jgi:membrane-bound lytic murein transglycosylase D
LKIPIILYILLLSLAFCISDTNLIHLDQLKIDSTIILKTDKPAYNTQLEISMDSLFIDDELFDLRISDAKEMFSEAIIADLTSDTMSAGYQFELLFELLSDLEMLSLDDEFQNLEFNTLLTAAITYYEQKSQSIDKAESGLSVAVLRDRLNDFVYSQTLEDLEYVEETIEVIPGHIPITYNRKVASIIKFFTNQGKKSVQKWLDRSDRYKEIMLPILEEEGVPSELFYVAMIESGLNPIAMSYAKASGFWQFIASTGKAYGLKKNWWVDERSDFEKSTHAAANYLKDLHDEFGDWYLAFAAYNCGEGRVRRVIKRHGTRDYWKLTSLPAETRNYVPNIMAAIFVAKDPAKYGFRVNPEPKIEWEIKNVNKSVLLKDLAVCAGTTENILFLYNPELRRNIIPPIEKNKFYPLRLPLNTNSKFDSLYALLQEKKVDEVVFETHKVRRGESLWLIAKKYNIRIQDIVDANKLQKTRYIKPGQRLQIPVSGYENIRNKSINKAGKKKIYYTVRYGDTLSGIAKQYYTSVRKLKNWNGLRSDFLRQGQKLIIWTK